MLRQLLMLVLLMFLAVGLTACGGSSSGGESPADDSGDDGGNDDDDDDDDDGDGDGDGDGDAGTPVLSGGVSYLNADGGIVRLSNEETGESISLENGETEFEFEQTVAEGDGYSIVVTGYEVGNNTSPGWWCHVANAEGELGADGPLEPLEVECGRYIAFNPLDGFVRNSDGLITLLFQTLDARTGEAIPVQEVAGGDGHPSIDDFSLAERPLSEDDGETINIEDDEEAFFAIVPRDTLNFSLRTVLAIDASVSAADDLPTIKEAALRQVTDDFSLDEGTGEFVCEPEATSKLAEGQLVSILVFGAEVREATDFTRNTQILCDDINDISTILGTTTRQFEAVENGLDLWDSSFTVGNLSFGNLIMITDSRDGTVTGTTARQERIQAIRDRAETENKNIFAIGVGDAIEPDELGQEEGIGVSGFFELEDFSDLEARLTEASDRLQRIANSLSQLEYATGRREGTYDAILTIPENAYPDAARGIRGRYDALDSFGAGAQPTLVVTGDRNVQPDRQSRLQASVRWTTDDDPTFAWDATMLNTNWVEVVAGGMNEDFVLLQGLAVGDPRQLTVDASVSIGTSDFTLDPVQMSIRATDVEAEIPRVVSIPSDSRLSVLAQGDNPAFFWSVQSGLGVNCSIDDTSSANPRLIVDAFSSDGYCTLSVRDTNNGNRAYVQEVMVGSPGTTAIPVSLLGAVPQGPINYDFENGFPADFENDSTNPWGTTTEASTVAGSDSTRSVRSGSITHNQSTTMSVAVTMPRDTLRYDYRVSSEQNFDFLEVYVGGVRVRQYSGETGWQQDQLDLSAYQGQTMVTVEWVYRKDGSVSQGEDAAWVDNVVIE